LMRRAAAGAATTGGGDSRDRGDVWWRLGAAGSKGRGQRRRRRRGVWVYLPFFYP
jgi:hypothetical protein